MKTKLIKYIGICVGAILLSVQVYSQGLSQFATSTQQVRGTKKQIWSMELRASAFTIKSFIDDWHVVNSTSSLSCQFAIAYDHGQNYYSGAAHFVFEYYLYKNENQVAYFEDVVEGDDIWEYVAYHEFANSVTVVSNDKITGVLKIFYVYFSGGQSYHVTVLPLQTTPNSITFNFNEANVTIDDLFQPQCPEVAPPSYYHVIQATNSIMLNPKFSVNSSDMDFTAEIIKNKNTKYSQDGFQNTTYNNSDFTEAEKHIEMFPNPSNGRFTVKNVCSDDLNISFYGIIGKLIPDKKINAGDELTLDFSHMQVNFITVLIYNNNTFVGKSTMIVRQ